MFSKTTAAVFILGVTLISSPLHAESFQPASSTPAVQQAAPPAATMAVKPDAVAPEATDPVDVENFNWDYAKGYVTDTGKMISSPLRWDSKDWLMFGGVVGGTVGLFFLDEEFKDFAQKNQNSVGKKVADFGNFIGEPLLAAPALGAFYLYGKYSDDSKARRTSLLALESYAISGLAMTGIKSIAKRHRPKTGHSSHEWDGPKWKSDNFSFASGHTSSAFSIATVFANEYKDNKYAPPVAYGLATLVALSRVYSNNHWTSDAFFGASLGYFTSKAVLSYHKKQEPGKANRLHIIPEVGEMKGLTVSYDF
jgi:membrane-associated phospholipid phosphatase